MKKYSKRQSIASDIAFAAPKQKFELTEDQVQKLKTVSHVALAVVGGAGFVLLATVAPNIFVALDKIFGEKVGRSRNKTIQKREKDITQSFYYLKRKGYVEIKSSGRGYWVRLTRKGKKRLTRLDFDTLEVKKPKKWQGSWWLVLADIPSDKFRKQADMLREKLIAMGFYPLQRTVWVYPYDPRNEIRDIGIFYRIDRFVTTMEVKTLDPSDKKEITQFFKERKVL